MAYSFEPSAAYANEVRPMSLALMAPVGVISPNVPAVPWVVER